MIRKRHAADRLDEGERSQLAPVLWAGGGFAAGIAFWHLIGFWSIVSVAVLGGGAAPAAPPFAVSSRKAPAAIETGSVVPRAIGCIALAINRQTGETRGAQCQTGTFRHINAGFGAKDDRATAVDLSWSTTSQ